MDGTAPAVSHERISLPFLEQASSRCTLHGAQTVLPRRFCRLHRRAFICRVLPWYWALLVPIQAGRGQGKQMGLASEPPCPFYADPNHLSCFICAVSFSDFILKRSPHMKCLGALRTSQQGCQLVLWQNAVNVTSPTWLLCTTGTANKHHGICRRTWSAEVWCSQSVLAFSDFSFSHALISHSPTE